MSQRVFIVDTNLFEQCLALHDLPWSDVSNEADTVTLLVPRTVQSEIDEHKNAGHARRSRRARAAATLFAQMLKADDLQTEVKPSDPRVVLAFSPSRRLREDNLPSELDLTNPDDRIVAEAFVYAEEHPTESVAVLTGDIGPLLTAKLCGVESVRIPDGWHLEPERDPRIAQLEERLRLAESRDPKIDIAIQKEGGDALAEIFVRADRFPPLSDAEVEALVAEVEALSPMREGPCQVAPPGGLSEVRARALGYGYRAAPGEQVPRYEEIEYREWLRRVGEHFRGLHEQLNWLSRSQEVCLILRSVGACPAENTLVSVEVSEGILIVPPLGGALRMAISDVSPIPSPPTPPGGSWVATGMEAILREARESALGSLGPPSIPDLSAPPKRDRTAFYWYPRRPVSYEGRWELECDEFRHGTGIHTVRVSLVVDPSAGRVDGGIVECVATAKNLPEGSSRRIPVRIEHVAGDTRAAARRQIAELADDSEE